MSRRSCLSRTMSGPTRLIRPRPTDCESGRDRQMKFSWPIFCFNMNTAKITFFRAGFEPDTIYAPNDAHGTAHISYQGMLVSV